MYFLCENERKVNVVRMSWLDLDPSSGSHLRCQHKDSAILVQLRHLQEIPKTGLLVESFPEVTQSTALRHR